MTEITSTAAYYEVVENGLVKRLHREIARALFCGKDQFASMTGSEIARAISAGRDLVSPRMPELLALGVVANGERRRCTITGHSCKTWVLTGQGPTPPPKKYFMKCEHCKGHGKIEIFQNEGASTISR